MNKINIWFLSSLILSIFVAIPIFTIFVSFFGSTSNYFELLKNTFLLEYINNSITILFFVLILTFLIGVFTAYFVSFYDFQV